MSGIQDLQGEILWSSTEIDFLLLISLWKLNLFSWNNFLICSLTCKKIFTPHTLAYLSIKWAIWHQDWQFKWEQTTNEWCRRLNLREPQGLVQGWAQIDKKNHFPRHERSLTQRSLGKPQGHQRGLTLYCRCISVQGRPQNSGPCCIQELPDLCTDPAGPSAPPALPCSNPISSGNGSSPKGGPAGWTLSNTSTQHSWVLAVPMAGGQSRLKLICRNLAKLSTNQCPEDAKPAWLLAPLGFSYFWCWWGGREECKTRFL